MTVASTGDTVDYQGVRLGVFSYQYDSPDGRPVYYNHEHDQYLYYVDYPAVWYVGDEPLVNMGGIINMGDALCPHDLVDTWEFYRWGDGEINDWDEDPYLKVTCGGEVKTTTTTRRTTTKPPTTTSRWGEDTCTWGQACDGCHVTNEAGGVVYCCAVGCDWGDVWVWQEDGVTKCTCSH